MRRTTVFLDEQLLRQAKAYARRHGVSFATVIREAVSRYLAPPVPQSARLPAITGRFASGATDTSARMDDLLWQHPHGR